eukprot:gene4910-8499_t
MLISRSDGSPTGPPDMFISSPRLQMTKRSLESLNAQKFPKKIQEVVFGISSESKAIPEVTLELYDTFTFYLDSVDNLNSQLVSGCLYHEKPIIETNDHFQISAEFSTENYYKHLIFRLHGSKEDLGDVTVKLYDKKTGEVLNISKFKTSTFQGYHLYYVYYNLEADTWNFVSLNEEESNEPPQLLGTLTPTKSKSVAKSMFMISGSEVVNKKKKDMVVKRNTIPLDFVSMPRILNLKIIRGNDLAIQDLNGFSDPYCKVYAANQKLKTTVIHKNLNPVWEEHLDFKLHDKIDDNLRIEVWDYDVGRPHDFLGQITLNLSKIELKKKYKKNLEKRSGKEKKDFYVQGNLEFIFDINKEDKTPIEERKLNIFGVPILEVMERRHETEVYPKQIKLLVDFLKIHAPGIFGIFRVSGDATYRKEWAVKMDQGEFIPFDSKDIEDLTHNVASVFKLYIRELPIPLLTIDLYDDFLKTLRIEDTNEKLNSYSELFTKIPNEHRILLRELLDLCELVTAQKEKNLMTPENLAVVFGIGVLKTKDEMRNAQDVQSIQKVYIELMHYHPKHFELAQKLLNPDGDDSEGDNSFEQGEQKKQE